MSPLTSMLAVSVCCFSIVKTTKDSIHSLIICLQMTFDLGNFVSRFSIINQVSSLGFNTQTRHPPETKHSSPRLSVQTLLIVFIAL